PEAVPPWPPRRGEDARDRARTGKAHRSASGTDAAPKRASGHPPRPPRWAEGGRGVLHRGAAAGQRTLPPSGPPVPQSGERAALVLEFLADFVDGVVLLAQGDDEIAGGGFLGLDPRTGAGGGEEDGIGITPEVMAHDLEGTRCVAELASDLGGSTSLEEIGPQGLVLTLLGRAGLAEEPVAGA